jgi:hypothetical protein
MIENINEKEINFNVGEKVKNSEFLSQWLNKFSHVKINKSYIDETICEILILLHKQNLVKELYEKVFNDKFYSGCDQYSIAVGIVLISKGIKDVDMLRSFELDCEEYHKNIIKKENPGERFAKLGYIPHNFLIIKIKNKEYIFNPKYTSFDSKLISNISSKYHSKYNENFMSLKHQNSDCKSLLFSDCIKQKIEGFNFKKYPLYIKDKKGLEKIYKSFERTKFLL